MGKVLTADEILKAEDRKTETVEVPEWGGVVMVREMNGTERDKFDLATQGPDDDKLNLDNYRARLVAACVCDEHGNLIFTTGQAVALGRKSSSVLTRIFKAAQKLNGMSKEAVVAAKKDSDGTASDASPSGSQ